MPRKGENIYKRKDGRWEGRITYKSCSNESSKYRSVYGKSYLEVKEKLKNNRDPTKSVRSQNKNVFSYYAEKWLDSVKLRCKISTCNKYRNLYKKHVEPFIGSDNIESVTVEQINELLDSKSYLSSKTISDILSVIKMIFSFAKSMGCNCTDIKSLTVRQENKQMRVLSSDEQKAFSGFLLKDSDNCMIGVYLCLCTGLRIGELCALKREHISFEDNLIRIRGTMLRIQTDEGSGGTKIIITEPKSKSSVRDIPISRTVADIIGRFYYDLPSEAYLLTGKSDKFIEPRLLEYRFKKYINACGIDNVNFHALRHTFATRCVENGFEIKTLSEILGHTDVKITLNRYVHSSMELKRANMDKMDGVF